MNTALKFPVLASLVASFAWLASAAALAADKPTVDMGAMTCKELMKMPDEDRGPTMGFYFGVHYQNKKTMTVDMNAISASSEKIIDECLTDTTQKVVDVFKKHGG